MPILHQNVWYIQILLLPFRHSEMHCVWLAAIHTLLKTEMGSFSTDLQYDTTSLTNDSAPETIESIFKLAIGKWINTDHNLFVIEISYSFREGN